jgi:hypothetical protein
VSRELRLKLVSGALLLILIVSVVGNIALYKRATRPLYHEGDRPLIERTVALAASMEHSSPDRIMARTFPITMRIGGGRTCVELRDLDGAGFHGACYASDGRRIEQIQGRNAF